jgi:hypothetical protein
MATVLQEPEHMAWLCLGRRAEPTSGHGPVVAPTARPSPEDVVSS